MTDPLDTLYAETLEFAPLRKPAHKDIKLTRITSSAGPLTKRYTLVDGMIQKESCAHLSAGTAELLVLDNISELEKVILNLKQNQALILGVTDLPVCKITRANKLTPELMEQGFRARTKEHFQQPHNGFVLLDYDVSPHMPAHLKCATAEEALDLLGKIPQLAGLQYLSLPSSSAGITVDATGETYPAGGMHIYIQALGIDLPQFRRWLEVNMWSAGLGYFGFARNGAILPKFLFDLSVLSPERLAFEARPMLGPGLSQEERYIDLQPGKLLTESYACTDAEYAAHIDAVAAAKAAPAVQAQAAAIRETYISEKGAVLAHLEAIPLDAAIARVRQSLPLGDGGTIVLQPDFVLDLGSKFITAKDLLLIAQQYDGLAMPDPIEGRDYGRATAKLYYNDGKPLIHSFAHGRKQVYEFAGNPLTAPDVVTHKLPPPFTLLKYSLSGCSQQLAQRVRDERYILSSLALMGQWTALYSPPNCGKTLLTFKLLLESLAQTPELSGRIFYINADDTSGGLADKAQIAEAAGIHMLAPGERGFNIDDFLPLLDTIIRNSEAVGFVIVLDTLKKFTDLLDKTRSARFGKYARQFVQMGGTLITLAHVNKRLGINGKPIPEGTADIINDADCAYVLSELSRDNETQEKTVKFENIKNRGTVAAEVYYKFSTAATVEYAELLASVERVEILPDTDATPAPVTEAELLAIATTAIKSADLGKMQLRDEIAQRSGVSRRRALELIDKFTGTRWNYKRGERGRQHFYLL